MLGCVLLGGCQLIEFKGGRDTGVPAPEATAWPFAPEAMRVYPFTSIDYDEQRQAVVLDLKVEMLDPVGDSTKAVGKYRIELYQVPDAQAPASSGQRLYAWSVPVTTLEDNVEHYNQTLRTYDFKLKMARMPPPDALLRVTVQFTEPGGRRLTADALVDTGDAS